jgi:hypothetical protein
MNTSYSNKNSNSSNKSYSNNKKGFGRLLISEGMVEIDG